MQPVDRSETNRSQEELSHPVVAFQAPPGLCLLGLRKFMKRTIASTGFFDPRQLLALSSLGRFLALFALAAAMTGPGLASAAPIWEPRNVVVGPARRWGAGIAFDGAAGNSIRAKNPPSRRAEMRMQRCRFARIGRAPSVRQRRATPARAWPRVPIGTNEILVASYSMTE